MEKQEIKLTDFNLVKADWGSWANCGIREIDGMDDSPSVLAILCKVVLDYDAQKNCFIFSGTTDRGRKTADALAEFIQLNELGTISAHVFSNPEFSKKQHSYVWSRTNKEKSKLKRLIKSTVSNFKKIKAEFDAEKYQLDW